MVCVVHGSGGEIHPSQSGLREAAPPPDDPPPARQGGMSRVGEHPALTTTFPHRASHHVYPPEWRWCIVAAPDPVAVWNPCGRIAPAGRPV